MNASTYEERMAVRLASQMASAQSAYDNAAEPEPVMLGDYSAGDLLEQIRIAEEYIGRAERAIRDGDLAAGLDHMLCAAGELRGE
jgi:hypothetical protein